MEYLFQFQIIAKTETLQPIEIPFRDMYCSLYLYDINSVSIGKKAHFVISGDTRKEAYENIANNLYDFNSRLMFLACQRIVIFPYPELVLEAQNGVDVRKVLIRCFNLSGKNYLDRWNFDFKNDFFNTAIDERHMSAMKLFNDALQADLPSDQFKSLFRAIEILAGSHIIQSKCPKCGQTLNPRATNEKIDEFLTKANHNREYPEVEIPKANELRRLRGKHSHVGDDKKSLSKRKLLPNEKKGNMVEIVKILSGLIRCHFAEKYRFSWGGEVIGYGSIHQEGFEAMFRTDNPKEKFAINDIPPIEEYLNHSRN
jgi:hypothetical protein